MDPIFGQSTGPRMRKELKKGVKIGVQMDPYFGAKQGSKMGPFFGRVTGSGMRKGIQK